MTKLARTPDGIEAEAALVRSQLVLHGQAARRAVAPGAVIDSFKDRLHDETERVAEFVAGKANETGLLLIGATIGGVLASMAQPKLRSAPVAAPSASTYGVRSSDLPAAPRPVAPSPSIKTSLRAALLAAASLAIGFAAASKAPPTKIERALFGQAADTARAQFLQYATNYRHGLVMSLANAFGLSRLAALLLVAMAMLGGAARPKAQ